MLQNPMSVLATCAKALPCGTAGSRASASNNATQNARAARSGTRRTSGSVLPGCWPTRSCRAMSDLQQSTFAVVRQCLHSTAAVLLISALRLD